MSRALARVVSAGLDDLTNLLEDVEQRLFVEAGQRSIVCPSVECHQEAEVHCLKLKACTVAMQRTDEAERINRHGDLLESGSTPPKARPSQLFGFLAGFAGEASNESISGYHHRSHRA